MHSKIIYIAIFFALRCNQLVSSFTQRTDSYLDKTESSGKKTLFYTDEDDNSKSSEKMKPWIYIDSHPKTIEKASFYGDLTLTCEVGGSPPPVISWLKNGKRIEHIINSHDKTIRLHNSEKMEFQTGRRDDLKGFVMAHFVSKLFIGCISPEDEGQYTCVAHNAANHLEAKTIVSIIDNNEENQTTWSQMCKLKSQYKKFHKRNKHGATTLSVTNVETMHMEPVGNDVLLPCQIIGSPKSKTTWYDSEGKNIIPNTKFKLTRSGSLLIRNLNWEQMGEYTCQIETQTGSKNAVTFLYPILPE